MIGQSFSITVVLFKPIATLAEVPGILPLNAGKKPIPKTQREISKSQQDPYVNPETGNTRGNPNGDGKLNRGEQLSFKDDNTKPFSLGFKEIDEAIDEARKKNKVVSLNESADETK